MSWWIGPGGCFPPFSSTEYRAVRRISDDNQCVRQCWFCAPGALTPDGRDLGISHRLRDMAVGSLVSVGHSATLSTGRLALTRIGSQPSTILRRPFWTCITLCVWEQRNYRRTNGCRNQTDNPLPDQGCGHRWLIYARFQPSWRNDPDSAVQMGAARALGMLEHPAVRADR